jgi:hypothetical protein
VYLGAGSREAEGEIREQLGGRGFVGIKVAVHEEHTGAWSGHGGSVLREGYSQQTQGRPA